MVDGGQARGGAGERPERRWPAYLARQASAATASGYGSVATCWRALGCDCGGKVDRRSVRSKTYYYYDYYDYYYDYYDYYDYYYDNDDDDDD